MAATENAISGDEESGRGADASASQPLAYRASGARSWLDHIRARPGGQLTLKIVVGVLGAALVVSGLIMVPFPGPGWLIVFAGLAVLATEFAWAHRLLGFAKRTVKAATDWLKRQNWFVRAVAAVLTAALASAIVWLSLKLTLGIDLLDEARHFVVR
ncbi:TIGR02611 family protein [Microtetraspora sp. NBRC 16547]|uniref:TIGR02611 family protein n=1 Tax=Microtetraspora sp. NBRC 16547 TaxID=3030993 RepID=UPI0024A5F5E1|nr:TIGR02611 family protein [Microtetraspora sp. NBRC 16547]GLW97028.1 membrane protein [Microtetraspora sp. NBRC 16547]